MLCGFLLRMSFSVTVGTTLSDLHSAPQHLVIHFNLHFSFPRRPSTPSSKNTILEKLKANRTYAAPAFDTPDSASLVLPCSQVKAILWTQRQGITKRKRPRLRG